MEYGLIGERLSHSFSKEIHESLGKYSYELHEIKKTDLPGFLKKREFKGINVTMPYKETVIPYLDHVSKEAQEIGAVNTIVNRNGELFGYNTDAFGLELLIKSNIDLKNKKVLILGSGGTSKTALYVVRKLGAKSAFRVSRKFKNFPKESCDVKMPDLEDICADVISYDEAYRSHPDADVIINTTPVGMYPKNAGSPIDISLFPCLLAVFDVIFNPLRTNISLAAKEKGIVNANGLFMLVAQAVMAGKLFETEEFSDNDIFDDDIFDDLNRISSDKYKNILSDKLNLVLIGMPTCGKTSVGREISRLLGKCFFDTDSEIEKNAGLSTSDFIHKFGEKAFRSKEKEIIEKISKNNNSVIATGGGSISDHENVRALKRNGIFVFIDRDLKNLSPMTDRPLADTYEKLAALYYERYPIYKAAADITIDGNHGITENAEEIISKVNDLQKF